jgi:hypothetical protein
MNRFTMRVVLGVLLLIGIVVIAVWASDSSQSQGRRGAMGPPPEAIEACKNQSEGASVQFASPRGDTITATCRMMGNQLAAMPDRGGPGQGPPPSGSDSRSGQSGMR